jgi:hypothetical protein
MLLSIDTFCPLKISWWLHWQSGVSVSVQCLTLAALVVLFCHCHRILQLIFSLKNRWSIFSNLLYASEHQHLLSPKDLLIVALTKRCFCLCAVLDSSSIGCTILSLSRNSSANLFSKNRRSILSNLLHASEHRHLLSPKYLLMVSLTKRCFCLCAVLDSSSIGCTILWLAHHYCLID